jgi:hypothetical protein
MLEFFQPYYSSIIWPYSLYINLENVSHIYFLLSISVEDTRRFSDITRYKFVDSMEISNSFGLFSGVFLHNTRQLFLKLYCHTKHPRFFPIMILRYIFIFLCLFRRDTTGFFLILSTCVDPCSLSMHLIPCKKNKANNQITIDYSLIMSQF